MTSEKDLADFINSDLDKVTPSLPLLKLDQLLTTEQLVELGMYKPPAQYKAAAVGIGNLAANQYGNYQQGSLTAEKPSPTIVQQQYQQAH